jgi:hypothetical protein
MNCRGTTGERFKANSARSGIEIKNIQAIEITKL